MFCSVITSTQTENPFYSWCLYMIFVAINSTILYVRHEYCIAYFFCYFIRLHMCNLNDTERDTHTNNRRMFFSETKWDEYILPFFRCIHFPTIFLFIAILFVPFFRLLLSTLASQLAVFACCIWYDGRNVTKPICLCVYHWRTFKRQIRKEQRITAHQCHQNTCSYLWTYFE